MPSHQGYLKNRGVSVHVWADVNVLDASTRGREMTDAATHLTEPEATSPASGAGAAAAPNEEQRILPFDVEHLGPLRRAVLDHLLNSVDAGPQSVADILAAMPPGTTRGTAETAIKREFDAGRIERVAPGTYVLAKPKPPKPPKPPPTEPLRRDGHTDGEWLAALEAYLVDPKSWDEKTFGPSPDAPFNRIPRDIAVRFIDRMRKREERRKEREAAAARQAQADAELREKLIAGCYGNYIPGPGLDDMAPVRAILKDDVPLEHVLTGLMRTVDRRLDPQAAPIASWRDERFLREVARCVLLEVFLPRLAATWAAAGTAPGKPANASQAAPAVPPANGSGPLEDAAQSDLTPASVVAEPKVELTDEFRSRIDAGNRDAVLDAFSRHRTPPQPTTLQPRPPQRRAEPEPFSEEAYDEIVAGCEGGHGGLKCAPARSRTQPARLYHSGSGASEKRAVSNTGTVPGSLAAARDEVELAQIIARIGNFYTKKGLSPPFALSAVVHQWNGLTIDEMIAVLEKHFDRCHQFYTAGSGSQHFKMVQSAMLKALEAKEHRELYPPRSSPRRSGVRKVHDADGFADAIDDREEDGEDDV
jgi:hypothetical protein